MQSYELDLFSDKDLSNTKRVNQIIGQDVKKNFKLILIKRLHPLGRGGGGGTAYFSQTIYLIHVLYNSCEI